MNILDTIPAFPTFDFDQVMAEARARHDASKDECNRDGRFIGASLGAWLTQVQGAGLWYVPARLLSSVPRDAFLRIETPDAADAAMWEDLRQQLASLPARFMARWDHCSSLELKEPLAAGRAPTHEETTTLHPWDPRAYDLTLSYPGDNISVWARPWVDAVMIDSYPLEFRVFIQDSQVIGVASYYPQRPLPDSPEIQAYAEECKALAERLIAYMVKSGAKPWMSNYRGLFSPDAVHATVDFLVSTSGDVLFLEAGPPFGAGAHPCAFIDRNMDGVALALAPGATLR